MRRVYVAGFALGACLAVLAPAAQAQAPAAASAPAAQAAATPAVDPQAVAALTRMGAYLRSLKAFQVESSTTDEDVLDDGQKIQSASTINFLAQMPDRLRVSQSNDRVERLYLYDGKHVTLLAQRMNMYATVPAPPTTRQVIDLLYDKYGIDVPLVDLFLWGAPGWTPAAITGAMLVGPSVVGGTTCDQYAFRQDEVDYQVWIQKGDFPLPRRVVITTKTDEARPQHTASFTWNLAPSFNEGAFVLDPPAGAQRVVLAELPITK
jgi:hypothetical protein